MTANHCVCSNCKYFKRYYVIGCDGAFKATILGRCSNGKVARSISSRKVKKDEGCDLWQPRELQKLRIQYSIEERLQDINKNLETVIALLRSVE